MHPIVKVMEVAGQLSRQGIREAIHTFQDGIIASGANEGRTPVLCATPSWMACTHVRF